MIKYREIIPIRLKYLRNKFSFTQEDIANQLGISQSNYANYEAGRKILDIEKIARLADIYETSVDLLLGRTDIKKEQKMKYAGFFIVIEDRLETENLKKTLYSLESQQKEGLCYYYSSTGTQRKSKDDAIDAISKDCRSKVRKQILESKKDG